MITNLLLLNKSGQLLTKGSRRLSIWKLKSGLLETQFTADYDLLAHAIPKTGNLAVGDKVGQINFFRCFQINLFNFYMIDNQFLVVP